MQINILQNQWNRVSQEMDLLQTAVDRITEDLDSVTSCLNGIDNSSLRITGRKISKYKSDLYNNNKSLKSMQIVFNDVGRLFKETEKDIAGINIQKANINNVHSMLWDLSLDTELPLPNPTPLPPSDQFEGPDFAQMIKDSLEKLKDIISFVGDFAEENGLKVTSGLLGLLTAGFLGEGSISDLLEMYKNGAGVLGELHDNNPLKILSSFLGVIKEGVGAIKPGDVGGTLLGMDDYINAGGDLSLSFASAFEMVGEGFSELWNATKVIAPAVALLTVATHAVGNIINYSKDGCYDINDYGNTCLDSGVSGGAALIKAFTFGIVDIDANDTVDIIKRNCSDTAQFIKDTNWPTAVQVPAAIIVSPAVAVVSVFHSVVDTFTKAYKNLETLSVGSGAW